MKRKQIGMLIFLAVIVILLFVTANTSGVITDPENYQCGVYATVFAGIRQLDGAEETVNYRTLVEDSLETSEADVQDERFLYTYVLFLRAAAIMALIYMIVRWLF